MQDLEDIKNKVNLLSYILSDAPASRVKRSGTTTFLSPCPFCNKGIRSPHFAIYEASNSFSSFGCEKNSVKGGTILDYIMATENLNNKGAVKRLYEITNTPFEETTPRKPQEINPRETQEEAEKKQREIEQKQDAINKFCLEGYKKMEYKQELIDYLEKRRSISQDAISKYHLFACIDKAGAKRVYIPIIEDGKAIAVIGRAIEDGEFLRYKNSSGAIKPFNLKYLSEEAKSENEPLFICEGVFDAITIEEQGFKAVALNSTNNANKFIDAVKENLENAKTYKFIIATDTDEARKKSKGKPTRRID